MKRYLIYLAIVAISSSIFLTPYIPPKPIAHAEAATVASKQAVHPKARPKVDAAAPVQTPAVVPPTFNPNDQSTWPTCTANQYVRADNGQCSDKSIQPTVSNTAMAPSVSSSSHEDLMAAAGIATSDYNYVDYIVDHENASWDSCRVNGGAHDCNYAVPVSQGGEGGGKAYGMCQALPGSKMAVAGADWATNPITQLRWCAMYAASAHGGGWYNNYLFWIANKFW